MCYKKNYFYDSSIFKDYIRNFPKESLAIVNNLLDCICMKEDGGCKNDHVRKEVLYIFIAQSSPIFSHSKRFKAKICFKFL